MADQVNTSMELLFEKDGLSEPETSTVEGGIWMTVQQASNATGLSIGTVRRYITAKRMKSRRQGKMANSKLEVLVTQKFLPDEAGPRELELDADGGATIGQPIDDCINFDDHDQADQSSAQTVTWLRQKLDEKDAELKEKDAKIEHLLKEMAGASYRHGYLEAAKAMQDEKLLLLEDKSRSEKEAAEAAPQPIIEKSGTWSKVAGWFAGK